MDICTEFHHIVHQLDRFHFPFDTKEIPKNGIYILFEQGECSHEGDRIVRVGTHTGQDKLRSRLKEHFIKENKDRSIFRKNIGRALLNQTQDPFLKEWNWSQRTRQANELKGYNVDLEKQRAIEHEVSLYIQQHFSFAIFEVPAKDQRLKLESAIVSTVSLCTVCRPSSNWLGLSSPKSKIRESGLWQVNELYKTPLSQEQLVKLQLKQ